MRRISGRLTWVLTLSALLVACEEQSLAPEVEQAIETEDPDAALVTAIDGITRSFGLADVAAATVDESDEAPAFGNQEFADAFGGPEAPELSADVAADPTLLSLAPDRLQIYNVMALWGRIRPNPNTEWRAVQWDPALQVAEGDAVRVRRKILFEAGDEVHPQEQRNLVTMTSWTGPHVDGVVAQVAIVTPGGIMPPDPATNTDVAGDFLAFRSEPYSVRIPADELEDLRFAEVIDDTGNGVLLASLRRAPDPCAEGFMKGRWARTSDRGGVFGGVWVQSNGRREGYLAGRWGVTAAGERVFRGKIVNMQGEFLAFMTGTYGGGAYEGAIYGRGRVLLGHMKGRYTGEDGHGFFLGGWRQACETD